ncbi:MAG: hypothetical protein AAB587_02675 [Patescibacteria group bacterium]
MPSPDPEKIERLKKNLYSRKFTPSSPYERSSISPSPAPSVNEEWRQPAPTENTVLPKKRLPVLVMVFWGAVAFFFLSVLTALYVFYSGGGVVSSRNVDIAVVGPVSVAGGENIFLDVVVHNKNNTPLESVDLLIEYPPGTRMPENLEQDLTRDRFDIGTIPSGEVMKKTIRAVLFGEKDQVKRISFSLHYKVPGSNAVFVKEKFYDLSISLAPVSLAVSSPAEVNANQEFELSFDITSNSSAPVNNLLFSIEYPFGFQFVSATPAPAYDSHIWNVGDLSPGEKRTITVVGVMQGQNEEERTFRFEAGTVSGKNEKEIGVAFLSDFQSVFIKKPFVDIGVVLNNSNAAEIVSPSGGEISARINWSNTLPVNVTNGSLAVALSGSSLDRTSVFPNGGGFYRSLDNTIIWDKNSTPTLGEINPRTGGEVSFEFRLLGGEVVLPRNSELTLTTTFTGTRFSEGGVAEKVVSSATRTIKVSSRLSLNSRILYTTGAFKNKGPLPPLADKETTYTIVWTVTNTSNTVLGGSVRASLPPYIAWPGNSLPATEKLFFDAQNREIIWNLGDVEAGAGTSRPKREISFQVSFIPSVGQVGSAPMVINNVTLSGTDQFTRAVLQDTDIPLTIRLTTDPGAPIGHDRVGQ